MIYLDHAATTKAYPEVIQAMKKAMEEDYFNPASKYKAARAVEKKIKACYKDLAKLFNVKPEELIQTSGSSESTNTVFKGLYQRYHKRLNKIIVSKADHDASIETAKYLEEQGAEVVYLDVDRDGQIDKKQLAQALDENTLLVSILLVNNETGVIQDIDALSKLIRSRAKNAYIHADLTQAWGKLELDLSEMDIDFASFSAHKIHGPKGTGLLYKKEGVYLDPLIHGGGQQDNLRSGTENYPALLGMTIAAKKQAQDFSENRLKVQELNDYLSPKLEALGAIINFKEAVPEILSVSFPNYRAETLLNILEAHDIYLASSSACNAKNADISHVLKASKMDRLQAQGTIRISLDPSNTKDELAKLVEVLDEALETLKAWEV